MLKYGHWRRRGKYGLWKHLKDRTWTDFRDECLKKRMKQQNELKDATALLVILLLCIILKQFKSCKSYLPIVYLIVKKHVFATKALTNDCETEIHDK